MFGNETSQKAVDTPNGFNALGFYDLLENGTNGDGLITAEDKIYPHLLLWTDKNQNGISEPNELRTLSQAGITSVSLSYARDTRVDEHGNIFGFRGRNHMQATEYDHQIYDVARRNEREIKRFHLSHPGDLYAKSRGQTRTSPVL